MKAKLLIIATFGVAAFVLTASRPALAHHGAAAYDNDKLTTVKGTVTKYEFVNPHVLISVDAVGENGQAEHWVAEYNSNNVLSRRGWTKNSVHVGDQVSLVGHRAKNGTFTMNLQGGGGGVLNSQGKPVVQEDPQ